MNERIVKKQVSTPTNTPDLSKSKHRIIGQKNEPIVTLPVSGQSKVLKEPTKESASSEALVVRKEDISTEISSSSESSSSSSSSSDSDSDSSSSSSDSEDEESVSSQPDELSSKQR